MVYSYDSYATFNADHESDLQFDPKLTVKEIGAKNKI